MGPTHAEFMMIFMALFVILVVGVILRFTLRRRSEAVRNLPLMVLAGVLLLLEVTKQVYHLVCGDWRTWYIPLHFCSYFLVWYAVALFTRGRVRQIMYFCSLVGGITVTILLFVAPRMILFGALDNLWDTFNHFHTYFYHMGVMAYWIWLLMLNVYHPRRGHIYQVVVLYLGFFFVTIIGGHIFRENYTNVLHSRNIGVLENLRLSVGQFPYTVLLLLIGVTVITVVSCATYFVMQKLYRHNLNQDQLSIEG